MDLLKRFASSRVAKLLVVAGGSWRFWAASAVAATTAAVATVVVHDYFFDDSADGSYAYQRLVAEGSSTSNPNPSARILLMNSDRSTACFVDCENFPSTGASSSSKTARDWWEFAEDSDDSALPTAEPFKTFSNLQKGNHFRLRAKCSSKTSNDGAVLWDAIYCRGGNLNKATTAYVNQLPFSKTSRRYNNRNYTAAAGTAGTLIMQNTTEAKLVSSCYDEGIGTIYFDAVNGFNGYTSGQLQVQVAFGVFRTNELGAVMSSKTPAELAALSTSELDEVLETQKDADGRPLSGVYVAPDAAHCDQIRITDSATGTAETNAYGRCAWMVANLSGVYFANDGGTNVGTNSVAELKCTKGGTNTHFYRFWAPVQDPVVNPALANYCRGPMRFRIVRLDDPEKITGDSQELDGQGYAGDVNGMKKNGLLVLDNVIASYPAMYATAEPQGEYVAGGSSRNVIGWSGVLSTAYPKAGETGLAASAAFAAQTNAPPDATATSNLATWLAGVKATFNYRWRYIGLTNEWQSVELKQTSDGTGTAWQSDATLAMAADAGDVEFYYATEVDAPYYKYLDYSGTGKGTPGYSERISRVETHLASSAIPADGGLPSTGREFFFRLREGASDQLEYRLQVRPAAAKHAYTNETPFHLTADRTWKAFLKTTTNATSKVALQKGDYEFRVVGVNPGCVYGGNEVTSLPWSGKKVWLDSSADGGSAWTKFSIDAATGALMFMLVENATTTADAASSGAATPASSAVADEMTFTLVHADYQDFNYWSDAVSADTYVGAYTEGVGQQSGSSSDTQEFPSEVNDWPVTASASNTTFWTETFYPGSLRKPDQGYGAYEGYESFPQCYTPNGWNALNSQWVCGKWRKSVQGGDMALQLASAGSGSLSYINSKRRPRGVDQLTLKARVAQSLKFDDFAYYSGESIEDMKDYVFMTRAIMATTDASQDFDGSGTISLVAYYRPNVGCYEVRVERLDDDKIRLSLYKWSYDDYEETVLAEFLGRSRDENNIKYKNGTYLRANNACNNSSTQASAAIGELFIRCRAVEGGTEIVAGVMNAGKNVSTTTTGTSHYLLKYTDTDSPHTFGTFGVGAVNCPAQIIDPKYYPSTAGTFPDVKNKARQRQSDTDVTNGMTCGTGNVSYPSDGSEQSVFDNSTADSSRYINWMTKLSRWTKGAFSGKKALAATPPTGMLVLSVAEGDDESSFTPACTNEVTGFKYTNCTFTVRNTAQSLVRVATAKKTSADIVVDDVSFTQWCGDDYSDDRTDGDSYFSDRRATYGCPTNYVYHNAWVVSEKSGTNETRKARLEPARVRRNEQADVRSPLMDGTSGRGIGLGVISYTYENADSNCVVLVQYKECESESRLRDVTDSTTGWTTVATNDFSKTSEEARASGTISTYVGEHGMKGVMRIVIADEVVAKAQDEATNPGKDASYGSITVTAALSRDEPEIDDRCWWGWNLRTTEVADERSLYDSRPADVGLALALNNSVTDGIVDDPALKDVYPQHCPFVQTPTFATNLVGEVTFRARRMPGETRATEVAVFGAKDGGVTEETAWEWLATVVVTNDAYRQFTYRAPEGASYRAFRLAVIGVEGLSVDSHKGKMDPLVAEPLRVLIDEVSVGEAVYAKLSFRDVGAFRNGGDGENYLSTTKAVKDVTDKSHQPMVNEAWGVQGEVYAAQLEEEIDTTKPIHVYLHWFRGTEPWGYDKWRGLSGAKSAELTRATDTTAWVYRSSYDGSPAAVVTPTTTNEVVQYVLEVLFYTAKGSLSSNTLSSADWTKPSWYHPIDFNAGADSFSAYTILDTVAPGWAWINEVNIFGGYDNNLDNTDLARQYVEVAAPAEADLTGWTLKFLDRETSSGEVTTNVVAKFGSNMGAGLVPATKSKNVASNCVFFVLASPKTRKAKTLSEADGEVDGYWDLRANQTIDGNSAISELYPLGVQLVRPSGIIAHEIVVVGTNNAASRYGASRDPQKYADFFNALETDGAFFVAGCDQGGLKRSLGAVANAGATSNDWSNAMAWTPGRINEGQVIDPTHPTPFGDSVVVYLNVGRFLQQTVGAETTRETLIQVLRKGDATGLVVDYAADPWYVLGSVATNGAAASFATTGARTYRLTVGQNCSNSTVTVNAESALKPDLEQKFGLTADNEYRDAVMDWLRSGKDLYGNEWKNADSDDVLLAEYQNKAGVTITNMTLTSMYWLDIPPTEGNWILRGDLLGFEPEVIDSTGKTNVRVQVYMMISNKLEEASWATSEPHRQAHAPYVLRGLASGSSSQDYRVDDALSPAWTSVTFKITSNVNIARDKRTWKPLQPFVFDRNSFNARGDADEFQATIDVRHPASPASPGCADVRDWMAAHPGEALPGFFFYWTIDDRQAPVTVETLKADNTFK